MTTKELATHAINLSLAADIALYSLPERDIKGILRDINASKMNPSVQNPVNGTVFQLSYKNLVILFRANKTQIDVIDILNKQVYNPNNAYKPIPL